MLRRSLSRALLCLALASSLSACVSADGAVSQVTDSDKFRSICQTEPVLHAAFIVIAAQNSLKPSTIAAEQTAHEVISPVCANPPADVSAALFTVAEAYARVLSASKVAADKEAG